MKRTDEGQLVLGAGLRVSQRKRLALCSLLPAAVIIFYTKLYLYNKNYQHLQTNPFSLCSAFSVKHEGVYRHHFPKTSREKYIPRPLGYHLSLSRQWGRQVTCLQPAPSTGILANTSSGWDKHGAS